MPVGQPSAQTPLYLGQIVTVDPTQRIVDVVLNASGQRLTIMTMPVAGRWPVVGETWSVKFINNSPYLGEPYQTYQIGTGSAQTGIEEIPAGDAWINSPTGVVHVIGSASGSTDFTFTAGSVGLFAGTIRVIAQSTVPTGWLVCDGSSYSTTAYPTLFAAIGYSYGGSGNTFQVPNVGGPIQPSGTSLVWIIYTGQGATPPPNVFNVSGDLSGTLPSPEVIGMRGIPLPTTAPTTGQVLTATSPTALAWQSPASGAPTGTAGGDLSGTYPNPTVSHVLGGQTPLTNATSAGGDLTGTYPNPTVGSGAITAAKMAAGAASSNVGTLGGDLNGSTLPSPTIATAAVSSAKMAAGAAASNVGALGGDLSGTLPSPTVARVNGVAVTGTPAVGQAIVATGSTAATWQTVTTGGGSGSTVSARVSLSATQTLSTTGWTKVGLNSITYDPGNYVNTTSNQFTCPYAGYYDVHAQVTYGGTIAAAQSIAHALYKNGALVVELSSIDLTSSAQSGPVLNGGTSIQCNAGDVLTLYAYTNVTGATIAPGDSQTWMSVTMTSAQNAQIGPVTPARMSRSGTAQNITANTPTIIALDIITYDPGANCSTASNRYTCPATGYYKVDGAVCLQVSATGTYTEMAVYIVKNGTSYDEVVTEPAVEAVIQTSVSDIVYCNAGDDLQLQVYCSQTCNTYPATNLTYMAISQVGNIAATPAMAASCRAYRGTAFTPASGYNKVPLDTTSFDTSGMVDPTTNHRINIPTSGYYQVNANILQNVSGTGTYTEFGVYVYKNGTNVMETLTWPAVETFISAACSDVIYCNAGDYLELWMYTGQATGLAISNQYNYLSVTLVSTLGSAVGPTSIARAYRNAALTLTAGSWTVVPVDTVSFDPAGNFDVTTNHRYNVPATGFYQISGAVNINNGTTSGQIGAAIYKNGVLTSEGEANYITSPASNAQQVVVSDIIQCNAGDYLQLMAYSAVSGSSLTVGVANANYLSVVQVGNSMTWTAAGGALTGTYPNPTLAQVTTSAWNAPTLLNSWVNYGTPYETAGYLKDPLGFVRLKGLVKSGSVGTTIFTLPTGYRPGAQSIYSCIGNDLVADVRIDTSGNVNLNAGSGGPTWLSLAGITFLAEN